MDAFRRQRADDPAAYPFFDLLKVRTGDRVLDVGCGLGGAVRALAPSVGTTGLVVGVDNSITMIAEAAQRTVGLALPVAYGLGDAHRLPFADDTFDGCFTVGTFELIANPRRALAEMIRVGRSGARIVVNAADFGSWTFAASDPGLTRRILAFACEHAANGTIARELRQYFHEHGLEDVTVVSRARGFTSFWFFHDLWLRAWADDAEVAGVISATEKAAWLEDLAERDREGRFALAGIDYQVCGRKP